MLPIKVEPAAVDAGRYAAFDDERGRRLGCTIAWCRGPGRCVKFLDDVPWRVLAVGSSDWGDAAAIRDVLTPFWHPKAVLVTGARHTGVDVLAESCWRSWGGRVERHPAAWRWIGPCAASRRDEHMVRLVSWLGPAVVAAWPMDGASETCEAIKFAEVAGLKVVTP